MKNLVAPFCSAGLLLLAACQSGDKSTGSFNLLPAPQQLEITGTSRIHVDGIQFCYSADGSELPILGTMLSGIKTTDIEADAQVIFSVNPTLDLGSEGYTLEISGNRVIIKGEDRAGLLYGFVTLEQLMEDAGEQGVPLPRCKIVDFPALSYRAIHLDMKHHLEKREYYYRLMDKLALYKVNAVIAEVEDKLAYKRRPVVASEDAIGIEEWKGLCDYAMERNIEISPLVQGLGHASFILKHGEYKELRDDPESDWAFNPLDQGTYEVQFDLYLDAMEAMPYGRYLHVGGDEVHTTGRGSGKTALELQLTWLNKVCEFAEAHGRIPIFWDDMPIKYAGLYDPMFNTRHSREEVDSMWAENEHILLESLDLFPENCIYMRWNYSSPQAEGNIKAMEWFTDKGLQVMGATAGQTRWVLMPQNESNMENIMSFAVNSIEKGLGGLLLTLWDDDSPHFELYMRGILAFAEYSWSGAVRSRDEIKAAFRHREYSGTLSGEEYAFVDRLEEMAGWWNPSLLKIRSRNALRSMTDPLEEGIIDLPSKSAKGAWTGKNQERLEAARKVVMDCDELAATIASMKSMALRNNYRLEVYEQVNELVRFSAHALLVLQAYDEASAGQEKSEALARIRALQEEFVLLRTNLERVYSQTRILAKPRDYLLDQDHHHHLANQSISFDWQFNAELLFLEKIDREFQAR